MCDGAQRIPNECERRVAQGTREQYFIFGIVGVRVSRGRSTDDAYGFTSVNSRERSW